MKKPAAKRPPPARHQPPTPESQSNGNAQVTRVESQAWAGPLPPPAILEQFNDVAENGAERIFKQWETETQHRRDMERTDLHWSIFEGIFGKALAFLFVMAAFGLAGYAAFLGATWLSGFLAIGTIAGVVWSFVKSNRPRGPQK